MSASIQYKVKHKDLGKKFQDEMTAFSSLCEFKHQDAKRKTIL